MIREKQTFMIPRKIPFAQRRVQMTAIIKCCLFFNVKTTPKFIIKQEAHNFDCNLSIIVIPVLNCSFGTTMIVAVHESVNVILIVFKTIAW